MQPDLGVDGSPDDHARLVRHPVTGRVSPLPAGDPPLAHSAALVVRLLHWVIVSVDGHQKQPVAA